MKNSVERHARLDILLVEDAQITAVALTRLLRRARPNWRIRPACTAREIKSACVQSIPNVVLIDIRADAASSAGRVVQKLPQSTPLIAICVRDTPGDIGRCAELCAVAFLPLRSSLGELLSLIDEHCTHYAVSKPPRVAAALMVRCSLGGTLAIGASQPGSLTPRERQIAAMLAAGHANAEIASSLGVSVSTVKNHVHSMLTRLGFRRRGQCAAWYLGRHFQDSQALPPS
jgi:DNA-binding NarL/FixJ family response regulator